MTRRASVAMLGLQETAKSTYLGALWQLIQDDADGSIREVDVTGDRTYLQELGEQVAALQKLNRTDVDSRERLALTVAFGDEEVTLTVPDVSGETLRMLVEDRHWHARLEEAVTGADGLLLFVHPGSLSPAVPTAVAAAALSTKDGTAPIVGDAPFHPRSACTAAKLVDALENVLAAGVGAVRVGLVVSAWDMVDGSPTPAQWAEAEVPALVSYLRCHERVEFDVFGVSAQGGRLPQDRKQLLKKASVRERAYARAADGAEVPLARPLEWALLG